MPSRAERADRELRVALAQAPARLITAGLAAPGPVGFFDGQATGPIVN